jgi:folylpolyglutamate synthase
VEARGKIDAWNEEKAHESLEMTRFAGRSQTFKQGDITWLFDGAHTAESMNCCVDWVKSSAQTYRKRYFPNSSNRALIFNCTGGRNIDTLLKPLAELHRELPFSVVIFTTNKVNSNGNNFSCSNYRICRFNQ